MATCRYCPNPTQWSAVICYACRRERRNRLRVPTTVEEEVYQQYGSDEDDIGAAQREYHGDTSRDDL